MVYYLTKGKILYSIWTRIVKKCNQLGTPISYKVIFWPTSQYNLSKLNKAMLLHVCAFSPEIHGSHQHYIDVMASQVTGNLSVCSTVCLRWHQENIEVPHYWPFVRGYPMVTAGPPVISGYPSQKGGFPSQRAINATSEWVFPCHNIILMDESKSDEVYAHNISELFCVHGQRDHYMCIGPR